MPFKKYHFYHFFLFTPISIEIKLTTSNAITFICYDKVWQYFGPYLELQIGTFKHASKICHEPDYMPV